jgi:hypothetical protein
MQGKRTPGLTRLFIFCLPFLLFFGLYIGLDPFHVIYTDDSIDSLHWNRDVWSSKVFIRNYPKYKYTSYIFGGSRSQAFRTSDWEKYIGDTNTFHFDASSESIYGIYTKLKYIDKIGADIKNALIITDSPIFIETTENDEMIFCKDYRISGKSQLGFQMTFLKAYCSDFFFVKYIDFLIFKTRRPYMKGVIPQLHEVSHIDDVHNNCDGAIYFSIKSIAADSIGYYNNEHRFNKPPDKIPMDPPCIDTVCLRMLKEIKGLFDKHHTRYKIVIGPIYWQIPFNTNSLMLLNQVFGDTNVYNYSGTNSITQSKYNYYETSHYKISTGQRIMKEIYLGKTN